MLSDGLIGDDVKNNKLWVSCPFHKRNFELKGENAGRCSNDETVNIATFPVEERDDGWVYLKLPPVEELDSVLGTSKWRVRKEETTDPFKKLDQKLKGLKGRKLEGESHLNGGKAETPRVIKVGGEDGGMDW